MVPTGDDCFGKLAKQELLKGYPGEIIRRSNRKVDRLHGGT